MRTVVKGRETRETEKELELLNLRLKSSHIDIISFCILGLSLLSNKGRIWNKR